MSRLAERHEAIIQETAQKAKAETCPKQVFNLFGGVWSWHSDSEWLESDPCFQGPDGEVDPIQRKRILGDEDRSTEAEYHDLFPGEWFFTSTKARDAFRQKALCPPCCATGRLSYLFGSDRYSFAKARREACEAGPVDWLVAARAAYETCSVDAAIYPSLWGPDFYQPDGLYGHVGLLKTNLWY